jgi:outer membrane lipoprotein-sorting protein
MFNSPEEFEHVAKNSRVHGEPPPGHRLSLRLQMLEAFAAGEAGPAGRKPWRVHLKGSSFMRNWIIRVAAILIIGAAGAAFYFHTAVHSVAFADVVRAVLDIRTGTYKATMTTTSGDGHQVPTQHFEAAFKEPGLERMTSEQMTIIANGSEGKMLMLQPAAKIATVTKIKQDPNRPDTNNMFSRLRDRLLNYQSGKKENVTELGRQTIDGRAAVGYHMAEAGFPLTIWADAETALPLKIEMETSFSSMTVTCTMTDFNWGVPVEDALFSMEIPPGYTVQESQMDMSNITEDDLITMLQMYTSYMDGVFPAKFDMGTLMEVLKPLMQCLGLPGKNPVKPTPEEIQEYTNKMQEPMAKIARGIRFVMALPPASDWHYVGKGVKLNTPNTPIAWYRPEKSQTYRLIYADLSVADVPLEHLPRTADSPEAKPQ